MASADSEIGLAILINESGKLRMLSHRALMFAALGCLSDDPSAYREEIDAALEAFERIVRVIQSGSPQSGVPADVCGMLDQANCATDALDAARHFLDQARSLQHIPDRTVGRDLRTVEELAEFVAGDLLTSLHQLNDQIRDMHARVIEERKDQEDTKRNQTSKTFHEELSTINSRIKILSINALIEAKRAGEHGKTFTIVAEEFGRLSDMSLKVMDKYSHDTVDPDQSA